ncbi:MAG: acyl-CoA dehydrogenase family protein [Bacteriovorax sp.]|nr:acyl-CoA dehydrogenase family protein [Bacteriovorax sp.]
MKVSNEEKSMKLAESGREEWHKSSFLKEMFMGNFSFHLIDPFPILQGLTGEEYLEFYKNYKRFLIEEVDADLIDREGKIPKNIIDRLKEMKLFALKIGKEYGGLGFTQAEYNEILKLTSSKDSNLSALLSAHQSIGVPQPLILFGTKEQKEKYLTRIALGQISAFALTETNAGSDPANLSTTVVDEGDYYILNGEKLWCTNVTIADVIVVMARHPEDDLLSAFIVEMNFEGVKVEHRCHFMGLRALENGVVSFKNVKIPKENLISERGNGLKVALVTLNTGRLALPAAISGLVKKNLEIARLWSREREQWGKPIYKHEAIAHKIADLASSSFAVETISDLATALYDNHQDIRLEAAVAKLFCSEIGWECIDTLLQIRGGRGYETADSLKTRGEANIPVEKLMRDFRINRIFEGTTEIMHLFIAREAVDKHLKIAGVLLAKDKSIGKKIKGLPKIVLFYFSWYSKLWMSWNFWPSFGKFKEFSHHLRFINRSTKKLARQIFHGMIIYGPGLQNKQVFLFRIVDIAVELYVMAACISKARQRQTAEHRNVADIFCTSSTIRVKKLFNDLWSNCDDAKYELAKKIENDEYLWLEDGIVELTQDQKQNLQSKRRS